MRCELVTTEAHAGELLAMMKKCGIQSTREMMEWALSALAWAVDESEAGHEIASIDRTSNTFHALHMPPLLKIRRHAQT